VRDALLEHAHLDLNACQTLDAFSDQATRHGYEIRDDDSWDDLFHRIFIQQVEPSLPPDRPMFLTEYPAQLPSLAKYVPDDTRYVERFELYIGGLELANAFTELNDPDEQRRRFEADQKIKQNVEGYTGGVDETLLEALEHGMPPAGGIALGLDRLMMIFADVPSIDPVILFRDY
jgi:elongation factor P--beta-lysine ligase